LSLEAELNRIVRCLWLLEEMAPMVKRGIAPLVLST
jgi:hypothetical protein